MKKKIKKIKATKMMAEYLDDRASDQFFLLFRVFVGEQKSLKHFYFPFLCFSI